MKKRQAKKLAKKQAARDVAAEQMFSKIGELMCGFIMDRMQSPGFMCPPEHRLAHFNQTHDWHRSRW
jgi:hypothetical protein